jgi:hypothetical protein
MILESGHHRLHEGDRDFDGFFAMVDDALFTTIGD